MTYTETDGIYYDPKVDKIEQRMVFQEDYYNHNESIIGHSQRIQKQKDKRYSSKNWEEIKTFLPQVGDLCGDSK